MLRLLARAAVATSLLALAAHLAAQEGPKHGSLVISGGAEKPGVILERFVQLAG